MIKDLEISCEWGVNALSSSIADVIIIVDVLSFSTCVDIVISNEAFVFPYKYKDDLSIKYAKEKNAILASSRNSTGYTLSPFSLINIPKKTRLVLPSPNGSTLSFLAKAQFVLTGCLRNASAVANAAKTLGSRIVVVPAGEKWSDYTLRVSYEDLIGSGAIINELNGRKTEEAQVSEILFKVSKNVNFKNLYNLKSGLELIEHGFKKDVDIACEYNVSNSVPILIDEYFTNFTSK